MWELSGSHHPSLHTRRDHAGSRGEVQADGDMKANKRMRLKGVRSRISPCRLESIRVGRNRDRPLRFFESAQQYLRSMQQHSKKSRGDHHEHRSHMQLVRIVSLLSSKLVYQSRSHESFSIKAGWFFFTDFSGDAYSTLAQISLISYD